MLAFSAISILFLFILQLVQGKLPLHLNDPATQMTPALAWNTAVSFVTNTNWQAYSGESTRATWYRWPAWRCRTSCPPPSAWPWRSPSSAASRARDTGELGNFWVDLVRGTLRILLPISIVGAVILIAGGAIQNFHLHAQIVNTLAGGAADDHRRAGRQPGSIEELGTNGGGFFNANSAHPFENPTTWTNWVEIFLLLVIASRCPARSAGWSAARSRVTRSSRSWAPSR